MWRRVQRVGEGLVRDRKECKSSGDGDGLGGERVWLVA